jgi:hypothetical protein
VHPEAARLRDELTLEPHPEGGWYRQTYRSRDEIPASALPAGYGGPRAFVTAILYLLADGAVSRLHRLRGDELWLYHAGAGLDLHVFGTGGYASGTRDPDVTRGYERLGLGLDAVASRVPQVVVPGGCWFGATLPDPDGFALVGCTMAPGFDFADFELGMPAALRDGFPEHAGLLSRLV